MSSLSFNWKRIEESPENSDDVRLLIEDVDERNKKTGSVLKQPLPLLIGFIQKFQMEKFFQLENKQEKEKKMSKKDLIIIENEKKTLESDLKQFEFNDDFTLKRVHFLFPVNNYLYILYWCLIILRGLKEKKKIQPIIILDATLSINRILLKDVITDESYKSGFIFFNKKMNSLINESFYNLLFQNPKMLYQSSFQKFNKEIHLYKEQKIILEKIKSSIDTDTPLLLGNQMPTGQGKTFLSVPLAKMLSMEKRREKKKCVLFACSNELVNMDVASNALIGNDIHLWMAKNLLIDINDKKGNFIKRDFRVLLRPYKSCFPNTWKKVYKKKEDDKYKNGEVKEQWMYYTKATGKIPDIIVADLESCRVLLKEQHNLVNMFVAENDIFNPFIAYIDEFIGDDKSNKKMVEICRHLPRQTVLLSSVLPKFEYIPSIVSNFCSRHETTREESCSRVSSTDISIPCCIVSPDGYARFPHHQVSDEEGLVELIYQMNINPRIRRTYSPKDVYFLAKTIEDILPDDFQFSRKFPNIGSINMKDITNYICSLLLFLKDNVQYLTKFQEYRPKIMNSIKKENIFTSQSWEYEPKTLVVMNDPLKQVIDLTETLFKNKVKIDKLIVENEKNKEGIKKQLESMKNKKYGTDHKKKGTLDKTDMLDKLSLMEDEYYSQSVSIPSSMILNHIDHFKRFNKNETPPKIVNQLPGQSLKEEYFSSFSDDEIYQLFSGIGTYDAERQTEFQRNLIMKLYNHLSFFCSGKEIVYGTNLSGLVNIFIDNDFMNTINIPELYQLMGRVGRMGRSYHANIITMSEETVNKLLSFDESFESENDIEKLF